MSALATWVPRGVSRGAIFNPRCLTRLGTAIERLEQFGHGAEMDAELFRALGWAVAPPLSARSAWRVRSPLSSTWMPMPPVTTLADGAAILVPPGWDYGCGRRGAHAFGWCRHGARFTETTSFTPALALARAGLHAWRHTVMESDAS
jgi:hypothetical protein